MVQESKSAFANSGDTRYYFFVKELEMCAGKGGGCPSMSQSVDIMPKERDSWSLTERMNQAIH
jgi:hypothetical protein